VHTKLNKKDVTVTIFFPPTLSLYGKQQQQRQSTALFF